MRPTLQCGQRGFTLWELMIALTVAGIVLGLGVPSFKEFTRNSAMSGAVNDLVTAVLMARTESVKRQAPVTLCSSGDPLAAAPTCSAGTGGFIVFADDGNNGATPADAGNAAVDAGETILLRREAPGGTINVWSDGGNYITYGRNGFKRQATGQPKNSATEVLYCDDRGNVDRGGISTARLVKIDQIGRASVDSTPADISGSIGDFAGASCP